MANSIQLLDVYQIALDPELAKLSKPEKHKLMDSLLQSPVGESKRGLKINFTLSSSGRRTNDRIYTPKGHQGGISTWLEPFPKPIIVNHDRHMDPLGRFTDVKWESNEAEALKFFKKIHHFMALKEAFDSDEPRKIYKALKKYDLLTNRHWPGLGRLQADALIVDEKAVEKFLDRRYLTFSAGAETDRYVCGLCESDWKLGDFCEHVPGQVTDDGEVVVFITGTIEGKEGSVATIPANGLSSVQSMTMIGDKSESFANRFSAEDLAIDASTIYLTDMSLNIWGSPMENEEVNDTAETAVVEETAQEEQSPETIVEDSAETNTLLTDELVSAVATKVVELLDAKAEPKVEAKEEVESTISDVDWQLLDLALDAEVVRAQGTVITDRDALAADAFCGPDKLFPICDAAYARAAEVLLGKTQLNDTVKAELLAQVKSKASQLKITDCSSCAAIQEDFAQALKTIEQLQASVADLQKNTTVTDTEDVKIEDSEKKETKNIETVENPSVDSSYSGTESYTSTKKAVKLSDYERKVVDNFKAILNDEGETSANLYLARVKARGYLPRKFDPMNLAE